MVLSSEWSQVEVIDLNHDGASLGGLGFILVGGRSTGVVIKALIPGGIADRDGRLQCGDHVLQIGDVNLRGERTTNRGRKGFSISIFFSHYKQVSAANRLRQY